MNWLDTDPLFAGFANLSLPGDVYDLGEGFSFTPTYGYLMASLTMATSRRTQERPYGEPWAAVGGGFAFEVSVQLHIPRDFQRNKWFDRLNTVWWIAALVRLQTTPAVVVPVLSNRPIASAAEDSDVRLVGLEMAPRRVLPDDRWQAGITRQQLDWIRRYWIPAGILMNESPEFRTVMQAFDYATTSGSVGLALISLWGALEELFSPAKQELRFRVATAIACYLEDPGNERLLLHKQILKLYDARSRAAHGTAHSEASAFADSYELMARVLTRIIESGRVPDRQYLEERVFGCHA